MDGELNKPIIAASSLMWITFLVHVLAGGPELYSTIRASTLSAIEISTWSVVWHFVSLHLFLTAISLAYLAKVRNKALFMFVFGTMVGFAGLFLIYGLADLGTVWLMPQWTAFVLTAALMIWGGSKT